MSGGSSVMVNQHIHCIANYRTISCHFCQVQSNVLSMLTRMRQIALHPGLVPANYLEELRVAEANDKAGETGIAITPAEKLRLQSLLAQAIEDCEECPICFGILPNDARITSCAHIFCIVWCVPFYGLCVRLMLITLQYHGNHKSRPQMSIGQFVTF